MDEVLFIKFNFMDYCKYIDKWGKQNRYKRTKLYSTSQRQRRVQYLGFEFGWVPERSPQR